MNILHIYRTLDRKAGGPATSVPALCRELALKGHKVTLLTLNAPSDNTAEPVGKVKVIEAPSGSAATIIKRKKCLEDLIANQDIVHLNGVWPLINAQAAKVCFQLHQKVVVSPRSSLMEQDINATILKGIKKHIAWRIYYQKLLKRANGIHVTAANELKAIEEIGFGRSTALIPNGINIREFEEPVSRKIIEKKFPQLKQKRILLFLSRISRKKGLPILLHAWKSLAHRFKDWHLLIAGPDDQKIWRRYQEKGVCNRKDTTYAGTMVGNERLSALWSAELFVLPTYWENFGIVLAEALMARTPIITTRRAPWEFAKEEGFGWIIDPEQQQLVQALDTAMSSSCEEHEEMGKRGRKYVSENFNWHKIATRMENYYRYILRDGPRPDFVSRFKGRSVLRLPW